METPKNLSDFQAAVQDIIDNALHTLATAEDLKTLENIRVTTFGKKGAVTALLKQVSCLDKANRPAVGQLVNNAKVQLFEKLNGFYLAYFVVLRGVL